MSRWRKHSEQVIAETIAAHPDLHADIPALFKEVSKAYPFGERAMHPYKIWLSAVKRERKQWEARLTQPTQTDRDVCAVAGDLVLMGREEEARQLLEQAPNRLSRKCPACGAAPCVPCRELVETWEDQPTLLVPHTTRLEAPGSGELL